MRTTNKWLLMGARFTHEYMPKQLNFAGIKAATDTGAGFYLGVHTQSVMDKAIHARM